MTRLLTDLAAPAKLNLFLRVTGRREDGYHLLQSLFVLLDWQDTLHLEWRADGQIRRHDLNSTDLPAEDLCVKAARLLQQSAGVSAGVDISLHKVLPSGAGMGGGSSDAATVLLGLNRLWGLNWPRNRLAALALQLGADLPFFIGGCSAIVEGIGEVLTPVALSTRRYVVVKPPAGVETRRIFTDPGLARNSESAIVVGFLAEPSVVQAMLDQENVRFGEHESACAEHYRFGRFAARNDLQPVAMRLEPQVRQAVEWLKLHWGNGQMTGSGSACFARETAANASLMATAAGGSGISGLPAGWVGRMCQSLNSHPLRDWAD